jgi:dynein heavy chain
LIVDRVLSRQLYELEGLPDRRGEEVDEVEWFFCADMANIEPMYQYSLPWFVELFISSILNSEKNADHNIRLLNLNDHFKYSIYCNVSRSLFEKDKILFVLLLSVKITGGDGNMDPDEVTSSSLQL